MKKPRDWYNIWFDSPYYHLLYINRDSDEAGGFLTRLVKLLALESGCKILDLACGKGRHSIFLRQLGFDVTGVDLSPANIAAASNYNQQGLQFLEHDMRDPLPGYQFDIVLNLFTSFGYFENPDENLKVLSAVHSELKDGGLLVIDFMNSEKIIRNLVDEEVQIVENVQFRISRKLENGCIYKTIQVDNNPNLIFQERVQALDLKSFKRLLTACGFTLKNTYGGYSFEPYSETNSERLILIAHKN
jgi:SAM-dependent methyltransferase